MATKRTIIKPNEELIILGNLMVKGNIAGFESAVATNTFYLRNDEADEFTGTLTASNAAGPAIVDEAATSANPTLIPNKADLTTGIGWLPDTLHGIINGTSRFNITASGIAATNLSGTNTGDQTESQIIDIIEGATGNNRLDANRLRNFPTSTGSSAGGGFSVVWAEESQDLSTTVAGGKQWSFGNGDLSENGLLIPFACTVSFLTLTVQFAGTATVALQLNGVTQGADVSVSSAISGTATVNISVAAGDRINFITTAATAGTSSGVVGCVLQTAGVVGEAGEGVPEGGTTGQILSKINETDFNTEWVAAPSGGTGNVTGPSSSTNNSLVRFDGTNGETLANSVAVLTDAGELQLTSTANSQYNKVMQFHTPALGSNKKLQLLLGTANNADNTMELTFHKNSGTGNNQVTLGNFGIALSVKSGNKIRIGEYDTAVQNHLFEVDGTSKFNDNLDVTGDVVVSGTVDGVDVAALKTTVDGKQNKLTQAANAGTNISISTAGVISSSAAGGGTGLTTAQASAIAANTDKRSFPQSDENKLDGIETNATQDQTESQIIDIIEGATGNNRLDASHLRNFPASTDTNDYVDALTINGQTLTLGRTGTLADLTATLPATTGGLTTQQVKAEIADFAETNSTARVPYSKQHLSTGAAGGAGAGAVAPNPSDAIVDSGIDTSVSGGITYHYSVPPSQIKRKNDQRVAAEEALGSRIDGLPTSTTDLSTVENFAKTTSTDKVKRSKIFEATAPTTTQTEPTAVSNTDKEIDTSPYNDQPKGLVILDGFILSASQSTASTLFATNITDREYDSTENWTTVNNADDKTGMCLSPLYLHAGNYSNGTIYAWDRTTKAAVTSKNITCNTSNSLPIAIYSPDGLRILCSQDRSTNIFTYNIADGTEDTTTAYSFTFNSALTRIDAMWGYDDYIWFAGRSISTAYCHSISTGLEITAGNFELDSGNDDPTGMTGSTSLGMIVISDRNDDKIYHYDLTLGADVVTAGLAGSAKIASASQVDTATDPTALVNVVELERVKDSIEGTGLTTAQASAIAANTDKRSFPQSDENKLDGIETNATQDQTESQIIDIIEGATGNNRLDASHLRNFPASTDTNDNDYVDSLNVSGQTLTLGRTGTLADLTATLPASTFTLDDIPDATSTNKGLVQFDATSPLVGRTNEQPTDRVLSPFIIRHSLDSKQNTLTQADNAGTNITISAAGVISSSAAGSGGSATGLTGLPEEQPASHSNFVYQEITPATTGSFAITRGEDYPEGFGSVGFAEYYHPDNSIRLRATGTISRGETDIKGFYFNANDDMVIVILTSRVPSITPLQLKVTFTEIEADGTRQNQESFLNRDSARSNATYTTYRDATANTIDSDFTGLDDITVWYDATAAGGTNFATKLYAATVASEATKTSNLQDFRRALNVNNNEHLQNVADIDLVTDKDPNKVYFSRSDNSLYRYRAFVGGDFIITSGLVRDDTVVRLYGYSSQKNAGSNPKGGSINIAALAINDPFVAIYSGKLNDSASNDVVTIIRIQTSTKLLGTLRVDGHEYQLTRAKSNQPGITGHWQANEHYDEYATRSDVLGFTKVGQTRRIAIDYLDGTVFRASDSTTGLVAYDIEDSDGKSIFTDGDKVKLEQLGNFVLPDDLAVLEANITAKALDITTMTARNIGGSLKYVGFYNARGYTARADIGSEAGTLSADNSTIVSLHSDLNNNTVLEVIGDELSHITIGDGSLTPVRYVLERFFATPVYSLLHQSTFVYQIPTFTEGFLAGSEYTLQVEKKSGGLLRFGTGAKIEMGENVSADWDVLLNKPKTYTNVDLFFETWEYDGVEKVYPHLLGAAPRKIWGHLICQTAIPAVANTSPAVAVGDLWQFTWMGDDGATFRGISCYASPTHITYTSESIVFLQKAGIRWDPPPADKDKFKVKLFAEL